MIDQMKKYIQSKLVEYTGRELAYHLHLLKNQWLRKTKPVPSDHLYLFILAPPYSGSTILNEWISSSSNVSNVNPIHTREGQTLPEVRKILFENNNRWNPDYTPDWNFIKKVWHRYWDITKPILLEKSPPNIIRAAQLRKEFPNSFFLIMTRNPYAHAASMMNRASISATKAATNVIRHLEYQTKNIAECKNKIAFTYSDLCDNPDLLKSRIIEKLPLLNDIRTPRKFTNHNTLGKELPLVNMNEEKIGNLTSDQLEEMTKVFADHTELLASFNYSLS